MHTKTIAALLIAVTLAGCETPTTQRYAVSADNNVAIKSLGTSGVGVASFRGPADFSPTCRGLGPMQVADGLSHTAYIQKAFEDELKLAGAFASGTARVTLQGKIDRLEFSSTRAVTGGSWSIELGLSSSNGRALRVNEYYEFSSGFAAQEACRNTAEAFSRAVQNLVGKAVRNSEFAALVKWESGFPTPPPAPAPNIPAAGPQAALRTGQDSYSAERLAKAASCHAQPVAQLVAKGPGFETYTVACMGGDALAVRCEFGNCRLLR